MGQKIQTLLAGRWRDASGPAGATDCPGGDARVKHPLVKRIACTGATSVGMGILEYTNQKSYYWDLSDTPIAWSMT